MTLQRTLIIGLGSPHCDDAVGWQVIEQLRTTLAGEAELHAAAHPSDILEHLEGVTDLHICDACRGGGRRGQVHRWQWPEFVESARVTWHSSHAISLDEVLRLGERLGLLPARVTIWGVEVGGSFSSGAAPLPVIRVSEAMLRQISGELRHA